MIVSNPIFPSGLFESNDIPCYSDSLYRRNKSTLKILSKTNFDKIVDLIPDVGYLVFYNFTDYGFKVKIMQDSIESEDIILYFNERFKKYNKSNGYFRFLSYYIDDYRSYVIFDYEYTIFERLFIKEWVQKNLKNLLNIRILWKK